MWIVSPPVTTDDRWSFRGSLNYAPNGTARTGLREFTPSFITPLLRIKTIANAIPNKYKKPPDHWFLAGNLTILYGSFRDARTFKVPLNADSVYPLEPIATPFRIGFDAVDWLPDLEVQIYEWTDPLIDPVQSAIDDLRAQIDLIQSITDTNPLIPGNSDLTDTFGLPLPYIP